MYENDTAAKLRASVTGRAYPEYTASADVPYAGGVEQASQPLINTISSRIAKIHGMAREAEDATASLRGRLFGPWPTEAVESPEGPANQAETVTALLDMLQHTMREVLSNANILNGRI